MMKLFLICVLTVATTTAAPEWLTFKHGTIGVDFAVFKASAGIGGSFDPNGINGRLFASASTPFGPEALAGLNGLLNGEAAGKGYANVQATNSIGASALMEGRTGPQASGRMGGEAHANGNTVQKYSTW